MKEGTNRVSQIYKNKEDTVEEVQKYKERGYDIIIHNEDGSVQKWEVVEEKRKNV